MFYSVIYVHFLACMVGVFHLEMATGYKIVYRCTSSYPSARAECGFEGITEDECLSRRCCFDESSYGSVTCFRPSVYQQDEYGASVLVNQYPYGEVQPPPKVDITYIQPQVRPAVKTACDICREQEERRPGLLGSAVELVLGTAESRECSQCREEHGIRKGTSILGALLK